jgi:hypothetical protein
MPLRDAARTRHARVCRVITLTCALFLTRTVPAGELPREPVRLNTWIKQAACPIAQGSVQLAPDVAFGLVAFNSPYLFGGKALRSQLTCGACHAKEGPSGAAVRLRLRAPVPDLGLRGHVVDVAAFVAQAVEHEFDGPPLPPRTERALSALASVLAPHEAPVAESCLVDGASLVAIGLRLCAHHAGAAHGDTDEQDFVRDSLRFLIGELAHSAPPAVPAALINDTNRLLRTPDRQSRGCGAPASLTQLAGRWDAIGPRPRFVVEYP